MQTKVALEHQGVKAVLHSVFRGIEVNYKRNLIKIDHTNREATFQKLDSESLETEKINVSINVYIL